MEAWDTSALLPWVRAPRHVPPRQITDMATLQRIRVESRNRRDGANGLQMGTSGPFGSTSSSTVALRRALQSQAAEVLKTSDTWLTHAVLPLACYQSRYHLRRRRS